AQISATDDMWSAALVTANCAIELQQCGDQLAAESMALQSVAFSDKLDDPIMGTSTTSPAAFVAQSRGRVRDAREWAERTLEFARIVPGTMEESVARMVLAWVAS